MKGLRIPTPKDIKLGNKFPCEVDVDVMSAIKHIIDMLNEGRYGGDYEIWIENRLDEAQMQVICEKFEAKGWKCRFAPSILNRGYLGFWIY